MSDFDNEYCAKCMQLVSGTQTAEFDNAF